MNEHEWYQPSEGTTNKARGMFTALLTIADSPSEAAQIVTMVYTNLWAQLGTTNKDNHLEIALQEFCDTVRMNMAQIERGKGKVQ